MAGNLDRGRNPRCLVYGAGSTQIGGAAHSCISDNRKENVGFGLCFVIMQLLGASR